MTQNWIQAAQLLIRHAMVLTMDSSLGDIVDGDVLIRDGAIVAVGKQISAEGAQVSTLGA